MVANTILKQVVYRLCFVIPPVGVGPFSRALLRFRRSSSQTWGDYKVHVNDYDYLRTNIMITITKFLNVINYDYILM